MSKITLKLLIDSEKNSLTFSKNYRIFSTKEPVSGITGFTDLVEDLTFASPAALNLSFLNRSFRYSRNLTDWSLWFQVEPGNLADADDIIFDEGSGFYFEMKYEYDDGTNSELASIISVNEIKLRFSQVSTVPNTISPVTICSDEKCSTIVAKGDPTFKPYNVDSAVGIYKELTLYANKMFGHDVVYFRTVPESDSGDFIFKEWTLFKNVDRKCLKILVPKNTFPSNAPKFTDFGLDFETPFEVHVDGQYFQSIFGKGSHPRYRDFLYFPLINRMYEVQGSYLHRGFMMEPAYWKVSLKKYNPNIDMLLTDDSRNFLDNVINSTEELFGEAVKSDIKDGTLPQQYSTISRRFDSARGAIHPDLIIRPLKYSFNYASLIENYYDLGMISSVESEFQITGDLPPNKFSVNLENLASLNEGDHSEYATILAYQESPLFKSWLNNGLVTSDKNIKDASSRFVRLRAPIDSIPNHVGDSEPGRYIRIEAYTDLSFRKQRGILTSTVDGKQLVKFKIREAAVIYKAAPVFNQTDVCNLSFTSLFNVSETGDAIQFLNGYNNELQQGIRISGQFVKYFGNVPEGDLNISIDLNGIQKNYTITNFKSGEWHAVIISISNEFKQCGVYLYSIKEDPADIMNHNDFIRIFTSSSSIPVSEFNLTDDKYYIPSSNVWLANVRLFNSMIKEEEHEFILSQQYIKDESKLIIIDNCKPQLNLPYIAVNR
jgi:hypothetical protein